MRVLLPCLGGVIYRIGGFADSRTGCVQDVNVMVQLQLGVSTDALAREAPLGPLVLWGNCGSSVFTKKLILVVLVSWVCLEAVAKVFLGLVAMREFGWWWFRLVGCVM